MAVDTKEKRLSMLYVSSPGTFLPLFEADGSVDADDRLHMLHLYSGIAAADNTNNAPDLYRPNPKYPVSSPSFGGLAAGGPSFGGETNSTPTIS